MKQKVKLNSIGRKRFIVFAALCAMSVCVLWSPGWRSAAQQQDRQLVQGAGQQANAGKRIALVIGNGAYTNAPSLKNPPMRAT